jgi:hypothetical protein
MKITNNYNLPPVFVELAQKWQYKPKPNRIGVTEFCDAPQIRYLKIKHWDELEIDVSEMLWMFLGGAVHSVLEKADIENALTEEKLEVKLTDDITLVGKPDLLHNIEIHDYKVCSAYAFLLGSKPEWERQLNLYRWMYFKHGFKVDKLKIHAILRDWTKSKTYSNNDYPEIPFQTVNIPIWDDKTMEEYLIKRIDTHTDNFPPCHPSEQWERPTQFAVMKEGRKSALRVLDTLEEAEKWIVDADKGKLSIVERKWQKIRCQEYCLVRNVCPQRKGESEVEIA